MARIPEEEIERLKREVSLERLAEARGVKLKRHGADLIGLELRCRKLGYETLAGRKTEKWEGSATPGGGWGDIWFDPELRYVIKLWSYPRKTALLRGYDLEQIEVGPQPDSLFELPEGYVSISLDDFKSFDSARSR